MKLSRGKTVLVIVAITVGVVALSLTGLAYAVSPPYKIVSSEPLTVAEIEEYILARMELALDDYSGNGALEISLEQEMTARLLTTSLAGQGIDLPGLGVRFTTNRVQAGTAIKVLGLPVGISVSGQLEVTDDQPALKLATLHLGRIPLPLNTLLPLIQRFWSGMPPEVASGVLPLPLDFGDISLSGLSSVDGLLLLSVELDENQFGDIGDIGEKAKEDLDRVLPRIEDILSGNQKAQTSLNELKKLADDNADMTKINPLTLKRLAEELISNLTEEEFRQVEQILEEELSPELKKFIQDLQNSD